MMDSKKHAFLIMAHNEFEYLKLLLCRIDYEDNDIFIHIDKKVKNIKYDDFYKCVKKSNIYFVKSINVNWGHLSVVECELLLFQEAKKKGPYHYYHLISGTDLILKKPEEIHEKLKDDSNEHVSILDYDSNCDKYLWKVNYYHPLIGIVGRGDVIGNGIKAKIKRKVGKIQADSIIIQKRLNVCRHKGRDIKFYKGNTWVSVTNDFVEYLISKKREILRLYKWTNGADEFFIQTLIMNSEFKNLNINDDFRLIDWNRGNPYVFTNNDVEELINSNAFFARKISMSKSKAAVCKLYGISE